MKTASFPSISEHLVDRIYEAGAIPDLWGDVLADLARFLGARDALLFAPRDGHMRWIASSPEFDSLARDHFEQFPVNERTGRLLAAQHAGFITDDDVLTQEELDREPVYQELLIPCGYGRGTATAIFSPSGDAFCVHAEFAN